MALPGGLGAVWFLTYLRHWLRWHYLSMSLSVSGLYGISVVEVTCRLFPAHLFWWTTVGTSMAILGRVGGFVYLKLRQSIRSEQLLWRRKNRKPAV